MFTRVVEIRCKAGKSSELARVTSEQAMPILRRQHGFQDEFVLVSSTDPNKVLAMSFWTKREDAENYQREQFSRIKELIGPYCESEPVVSTYDVHTSTAHHIDLGKAA
jgi:heme-degrading monooxygenase HmoA